MCGNMGKWIKVQTIGTLVDLHSLSSLFNIMWQRTTTGIIRRACLHLLCCSMYNANPQLGPTTYHTIPYHIPFPDVQWTSGPMRQCPCTRIMALHTNVQQMLVQKTNMHAVTAKKQNKYTLHTVPNVRSKSKYARTKLLCPAA